MSLHTASFENVLFLSFSHPHTVAALRTVLASTPGGEVRVLGVVPPTSALQRLLTPSETTHRVEESLREALRCDLDAWATRAAGKEAADRVVVEVATGHIVQEVLVRIADHDHDLLTVTGHPDDPVARAIISRLQRKSPIPVWVLRPDRSRKRRILAAVDVSDEHHGLDHRVLAAARWLARPGDHLHILTAWELVGEATMRGSPFVATPEAEIEQLRHECATRVSAALDDLLTEHDLDDLDDLDVEIHIHNGPAAEAIVDEVRRSSINQLVVGTIARHGIPGFVMGNTAEQLLSEVACSEFVVKPPLV